MNKNLAFPVHPDPVGGMQRRHRAAYREKTRPEDRYGDVCANAEKSCEAPRRGLAVVRPGPREDGSGRREVFDRPCAPDRESYFVDGGGG